MIVSEHTRKGTARHPQGFEDPLPVLSADDYDALTFDELHKRICDTLLPMPSSLRKALLEATLEAKD